MTKPNLLPVALREGSRDRRGSVALIAGLSIAILAGMAGLVVEFGYGMVMKAQNQRTADSAAYAGALAYNSGGTSAMNAAIANIAALNGLQASTAAGSLVASPSGDGNNAVYATVTTTSNTPMSSALWSTTHLSAFDASYAEVSAQSGACLIALGGGGTGITLTGGAAVTASQCSVDTNASASVPCGTTMTVASLTYGSAAPSQPCSGIKPPSGTSMVSMRQANTTDPMSGNTAISNAVARLTTVSQMSGPTAPSVSGGTAISFGYSPLQTIPQVSAATGCSATMSGSTWTVTCTGHSSYTFGAITVGGGISVQFNTGGSASTTYNFNGLISNGGSSLTFGPGTYNITQGISTSGGTTTSFGAGTFNVGKMTSGCNGGGDYSICNTGTSLTFAGPSTFNLSGGFYNNGGSTLTMGSGTTNSYQLGASSDGNAMTVGGGSTTTMADATGASSVFQATGLLQMSSGGGSCLTIPAAAEHDIDGSFVTAGGVTLGAGIYTVTGFVGIGTNTSGGDGGGDVTCGGQTIGVNGGNVTFVIGASSTPQSGSCASEAFCVTSGYSHVTLTAPTSGSMENMLVIGPTTSSSAGATFAEGASNTSLSGIFYFPHGPISLSGGASIGAGSGQCLQLIGSQISLSGGTTLASLCPGSGMSSSVNARLVR
jgi:Flp pilus assembly protein TadG